MIANKTIMEEKEFEGEESLISYLKDNIENEAEICAVIKLEEKFEEIHCGPKYEAFKENTLFSLGLK